MLPWLVNSNAEATAATARGGGSKARNTPKAKQVDQNGAKEYTIYALHRFNRMHIRRVLPHSISFERMGGGEETLGWRPKLLVNHDHE